MNSLAPPKTMFKNIVYLASFALPLSASMLVQMFTSFFAMLMVAKLGEKELAAGSLAVSTYMMISMFLLFYYAIGILVSHSRGQDKSLASIGDIVRNGLWLAVALIIPTSFILWHADYLLLLFRQDNELINLTRPYFHYSALFMPPSLISMVILQFFIGIGRPRVSVMISIVAMPVTIFLSYILILGKFGFPQLGVGGITAALCVTQFVICLGLLSFIFFSNEMKKYSIFVGNIRPDFVLIRKIVSLGWPIGLQFGGELAAMALATYFMGYFGVTALAAAQIASQYFLLVIMIVLGLSQAVTLVCSEAYGKQEINLISQYVRAAIYILSIVLVGIIVIFGFFPRELILFFGGPHALQNPILVHLAGIFFIISLFVLYADGIRNIVSGGLRGLHDSKAPMHVGIICLWIISIPGCYFIAFILHGGPIGLRIGFASGIVVAAIILSKRLRDKIELTRLATLPSS